MRIFSATLSLCLFAVLVTTSANANCEQVRAAVATYGYVRAAAWARVNLTPVQIRTALRCLRSARR